LQQLNILLDNFAEWTGRLVAWLSLLLVLVTFSVVVLRYAFNIGSISLQESILYLHASLFLLTGAYTLKQDAHVRVDIFYRRLSADNKAWVNLMGALFLLLPVCLFIGWISWDYVSAAWSVHEGSRETGGLPFIYLLKSLIPLGIILLALQGISQVLASLVTLLNPSKESNSAR
jgi:TRAP-type mannitol/chloroaromatic compound transport system permease small subunit